MKTNEQLRGSHPRSGLMPPKVLLLSVMLQIPLILWSWPLKPAEAPALAGAAMLAAGVVLNVRAERLFLKSGVGVCPFSPAPYLVNTGPYRLTRNPMYLGMVLLSASVPLITGLYRSEEHTSELQSLTNLAYRLLLEKNRFLIFLFLSFMLSSFLPVSLC